MTTGQERDEPVGASYVVGKAAKVREAAVRYAFTARLLFLGATRHTHPSLPCRYVCPSV